MNKPAAVTLTPESPCICGSGHTWRRCCGLQLPKEPVTAVHAGDPRGCVKFFLLDALSNNMFADDAFDILVFTSRAQALACATKINARLGTLFGVAGMTAAQWGRFMADLPGHRVVPEAAA